MARAPKKGNTAPEAVPNRALVAALPDGVIMYSADGQCRSANEAAAERLGIPRAQLLKQDLRQNSVWKASGLLDLAEETMRTGHQNRWAPALTGEPDTSSWLEFSLSRVDLDGEATLLVVIADIREHRGAEETLRAAEERYRELADTTSDLIFSFDRDFNLTGINRAAASALGLTQEEALGRRISDLGLPSEVRRRWERRCREVMADGRPAERLLNEFTLADGQRHINETSLWPIQARDGTVVGVRGVTRDIAERTRAHEALHESESRYQNVVECSPDAIVVSAGGNYVFANPAAVKLFGANSSQELLGQDVLERTHPDYRDLIAERVALVLAGGAPMPQEIKVLRLDGSEVAVEALGSRIVFGGSPAIQVVFHDITERKRAEQMLEDEICRRRILVDQSRDGIVVLDTLGNVREANQQYARMLGYSMEEVYGLRVWDWDALHDKEELLNILAAVDETGDHFETKHLRKDGSLIDVEISTNAPVVGGEKHIFCICRDITERRQAEEALRLTRFSLDRAVDCVHWIGPDGTILDVNESSCRRYGYSRQEMLGLSVFDLDQSLSREGWQERWREIKTQGFYTLETVHRTKEGKLFPVEVTTNYVEHNGKEYDVAFLRDITERKKIEEALRLTQLSVDCAADLIHWIAPDGRLLYVSDSTCRRNGYSREEMLALTIFDLDPLQSPAAWKKHWRELKKQGSLVFESVHKTKDGEVFPVELTANYVECGGQEYNFGFGRDITERKRTETAVKQANERLLLATIAGGVGIWELDVANNRLTWDDQMFRLYGMEPSGFGGAYETWKASVHPEDRERGDAEVQMALRGEKEFDTEFRVVWPTGGVHYIRARAQVHRDSAGQPTRLIGTNYDITEQKEMEESLLRTQFVVDHSQDLLFWMGPDGRLHYVNEASCRRLGYSQEELLNMTVNDVDPGAPHPWSSFFPEIRKRGSFTFESSLRTKDREMFPVEVTVNYVSYEGQEYNCASVRDITERKIWEEALAREKEHLFLLNEAAVEMSHCLTASEVQRAGIRLACRTTSCDGGVIWLFPSAVRSRIIGSEGLTRKERAHLIRILRTSPAVERAIEDQISVQLGDAEVLGDGISDENVFAGAIAVPISSRGKVLGVLCLATKPDHPGLTPAESALADGIASFVAVAMENARLYDDARYLAQRDPVTGLLNHRGINTQLEKEVARSERSGECFAVVMMDLDNFKLFNDTYGHASGDRVLQNVSAILAKEVRRQDTVGRYGGDEFVALLPGSDAVGAVSTVERIQAALRESGYSADGDSAVPVFMSYGVATYPFEGRHVSELLAAADANLYRSKRQGGNCVTAPGGGEQRSRTTSGIFTVLDGLVTAVDGKDHYTRKHSDDVSKQAVALASELGLSSETQRCLRIAALLHDVGKIGIPDHILRKPGGLTEEEYEAVKQHVSLGELIIKEIPNLVDVLGAVSSHHERYDGRGYPRGLKGENIPLLGRILAVTDAYSAMTTDRPYRKALTLEEARTELKRVAGTQLDPQVVTAFLAVLDDASYKEAATGVSSVSAA
jgi:diguanylate cyclase (GGDEF)-like protein/PAS domain S-box-containing protein